MSSISNISGSSSISYVPPTTSTIQSIGGGDTDGDNDGSMGAGKVGKSNFLSALQQALGQSLSGSSGASSATSTSDPASPSNLTQDPQVALQSFLHSLFAALHQAGGQAATAGNGTDSDGDGSSSAAGVGGRHHRGGSNLSANIQNLLQQLSSSSQSSSTSSPSTSTSSTDALGNLNSSFQNLINTLSASQGKGTPTTSPDLQSFLQNFMQDLSGGQNISGAVVNTKA